MRPFFTIILAVALSAAAHAQQNQVVVKGDSLFVKYNDGGQVSVTSAGIKAQLDEYGTRQRGLDELIAYYQKIAAMRERSLRMSDEKTALTSLLQDVELKEAEIAKNKKKQ